MCIPDASSCLAAVSGLLDRIGKKPLLVFQVGGRRGRWVQTAPLGDPVPSKAGGCDVHQPWGGVCSGVNVSLGLPLGPGRSVVRLPRPNTNHLKGIITRDGKLDTLRQISILLFVIIFEAMHLANTAEVFGSSGQSYAVCTMHFKWKVITMAHHHPSRPSLRHAYLMHAPFGKCKLARSHLDSCVSLCSTFSGPFFWQRGK